MSTGVLLGALFLGIGGTRLYRAQDLALIRRLLGVPCCSPSSTCRVLAVLRDRGRRRLAGLTPLIFFAAGVLLHAHHAHVHRREPYVPRARRVDDDGPLEPGSTSSSASLSQAGYDPDRLRDRDRGSRRSPSRTTSARSRVDLGLGGEVATAGLVIALVAAINVRDHRPTSARGPVLALADLALMIAVAGRGWRSRSSRTCSHPSSIRSRRPRSRT